MHTMLIRPTKHELENFGDPDLIIYNAGAFPANRLTSGMGSKTTVDLSIDKAAYERRVKRKGPKQSSADIV